MGNIFVSAIILLEGDKFVTGWIDCDTAQEAMEDRRRFNQNFQLVIDQRHNIPDGKLLGVRDIWIGLESTSVSPN